MRIIFYNHNIHKTRRTIKNCYMIVPREEDSWNSIRVCYFDDYGGITQKDFVCGIDFDSFTIVTDDLEE